MDRCVNMSARQGLRMKGAISLETKKLIEGIKEIVKGYNEEDIYPVLQECNMDPNETVQRLLSQDPFHEVKRRRDKKKENASSQPPMDMKSRPGNPSRGGRGFVHMGRSSIRASYRPVSQDANSVKGSNTRENGTYKVANKSVSSAVTSTNESAMTRVSVSVTSSLPVSANGITSAVDSNSFSTHAVSTLKEHHNSATGNATSGNTVKAGISQNSVQNGNTVKAGISQNSVQNGNTVKAGISQNSVQNDVLPTPLTTAVPTKPTTKIHQTIALTPISTSGVASSVPDPVYVPSADGRLSVVGAIKRVVGTVGASRGTDTQPSISSTEVLQSCTPDHDNSANSHMEEQPSEHSAPTNDKAFDPKIQPPIGATPGLVGNTMLVSKQYTSRSQQQPVGSQKAIGHNMEWKRKPPNQNAFFPSSGVDGNSANSSGFTQNISTSGLPNSVTSEEKTTGVQDKLEQLKLNSDQDLIMPNHLKVSEAACLGLSFGSFGDYFGSNVKKDFNKEDSDKCPTPSEESQRTDESNEEPSSRISEHGSESSSEKQEASVNGVQTLSCSAAVKDECPPSSASQSDPSKQDPIVQMHPQHRPLENAPSYGGVGLMPQIMGSQYPYEASLSGPLEASRQPSIMVQPPYDPSTSYATVIKPVDGDARFSPCVGPVSKHIGNTGFLSAQGVPTSQEVGSSVSISSAVPTAPGTQMAGIAPSTVSFPQQQLHLFHQPSSLHISHFPHTYFPYAHQYLSPLYFSPPAINNFAGNFGYAQPSSASNFPLPSGASFPSAATAAVKYSLSQFKPIAVGGNTNQAGFPIGYTNYNTPPSAFSSSPANAGSRAGFEENKETNLYIPSQQVDGPAFWFRTPQNISGLQSSSYYSLSAQGQNMAFAPAQSGHAAYAGIYHPAQAGMTQNSPQLLQQSEQLAAAGSDNPQTASYQHSQAGQLNWNNNY
eukprot:TRINITY_DN375_c0_g1_i4.p1 TRINITY_DN375_c0_g1~~TRINITY_DN375_c0_g1_i4.p1  ORF type:complete len:941 (-),score=241.75 TRINITY_DN375_c0_g1_i4:513-3335(-)